MSDDRVRRHDYMPTAPTTPGAPALPPAGADHTSLGYLGPQVHEGHFRTDSVDVVDEGYDLDHINASNSRTPLTPETGDRYPPSRPSPSAYPQTPQPAPTTGLNASGNRVHYPPSPYMATTTQQQQHYSTVPLNDQPITPGTEYDASGRSTPNGTAGGSGGGKKKAWSFLPMHSNASSLEQGHGGGGGGMSEKPKKRPKSSRNNSWDLLGDRAEWEDYNPAQASVENLRFAEGDVGTTKLSRLYYWALNRGIVARWAIYIIPVLCLLWIPGIVGVTGVKDATVWNVKLIWWSIWLTILWVGFWAATAVFMVLPAFWTQTIGSIIPSAKQYSDIIRNLGYYAKLIVWTVAIWISWKPLLINHYIGDQSADSRSNLTTAANIFFGLFLCTIVLAVEKLLVQLIALQFHRDSYEDRLKEQKLNVKCLTTLYINSHDIPGRSDTLTDKDSASRRTKASKIPQVALRKALRGLKTAAQNTTTALGNVASEMAGQSVLQTNSPANKVTAALASANKSRALARRIFYSFRQPGLDHLEIADVARFFPDLETAQAAFAVFDKDGNGDATRDEIDSAVLGMHRERLSLEASMRDLDGAVRRLDDIFMVVVTAICVLILAAMVTTKLTTLVTSASTFILSLSWLIGTTMQEILGACIFLFVKHPYDVGDRVDIDDKAYTVVKMNLMSTSFKRTDGKFVWIGHNVLATKVIENVRRSGATSETFTFEVAFDTSFEALQAFRAKMLKFCRDNSRDFLPVFDVIVDDMPAQGKLVLKADIKYKSNWQQGALKVQRRNKWICALKMALAELKIFGPAGAGDPSPPPAEPTQYTLVPWETLNRPTPTSAPSSGSARHADSPPPTFQTATAASNAMSLTDQREVVNDTSLDIWDEADELDPGAPSRPATPGMNTPVASHAPQPGVTHQARQRMLYGQNPDVEGTEVISQPVARR